MKLRFILFSLILAFVAYTVFQDTRTDQPSVTSEIVKSSFTIGLDEETNRYPHGALGDDLEPTQIVKVDEEGNKEVLIKLPPNQVFEATRFLTDDITGDGNHEILVTVSQDDLGAANFVYDIQGKKLAQSEFIGERFKWRMLVGVMEDAEGTPYLVDVVTPHLTGELSVYELQGNSLVQVDSKLGYFSHEYGSPEMDGAEIIEKEGRDILRITRDFDTWDEFYVQDGKFVQN